MKTAKLTAVGTLEAAELIRRLGGSELAYRDAPLLDRSQIDDLISEARENKTNCIMFDAGAIFDRAAYELARDAVDALVKEFPGRFQVVIYNTPGYDR